MEALLDTSAVIATDVPPLEGELAALSPAYLGHPRHGYIGIAPGGYEAGRQRQEASTIRMVVD